LMEVVSSTDQSVRCSVITYFIT